MSSPFDGIMDTFLDMHGGEVTVYRNYGTPEQTERVFPRALKNTRTKRGGGDIFQFRNREDIEEGDIIQQKGSQDLWIVTETSDFLDGNTYLNFDVAVSRASRNGLMKARPGQGPHVSIGGSVYGGLQVSSPGARQNVTVNINPQVADAIAQLRQHVSASELDELDKDEISHELTRIEELAKKGNEPKAKVKLLEKLNVVEKMLSVSEKLAKIGGPLVGIIAAYAASTGG